jgi:hypothetical protein
LYDKDARLRLGGFCDRFAASCRSASRDRSGLAGASTASVSGSVSFWTYLHYYLFRSYFIPFTQESVDATLLALHPRDLFTATAASAQAKKYALVVGINDYQNSNLPDLKYAERDVAELADVFK